MGVIALSIMMKFIIAVLAVTAVLAQETPDHTLEIMDDFLETESSMSLPCTPKTCMPVCKLVTKYVTYGAYKLPYQENVCEPDKKCLADKAACIAKLQAAMKAAEAAEKDMIAKAKLANAAKATKAQKDAAAAAKKKEEAAAASALAAAKAAFEAAEKEAAFANAASISAAMLISQSNDCALDALTGTAKNHKRFNRAELVDNLCNSAMMLVSKHYPSKTLCTLVGKCHLKTKRCHRWGVGSSTRRRRRI